ncbi:MAG: hypothetical protein ACRCWF_12930 [Beijerinckiaceae bacterium]
MSSETPKAPPSFRDLEEVMARSLKQAEPAETYRSLRLQPVVLPPPPAESAPPLPAAEPDFVSAEDDIEPDHSAEVKRSSRLKLAMAGALAVMAVGAGFWAYQGNGPKDQVAVPEIKAVPEAVTKTAVVPEAPVAAPAPVAATPATTGDASMGQVSTELVPPTTDGLSPARRISTIRIIVENDQEVRALR